MNAPISVPDCPGTTVREVMRAHGLQFLDVNIQPDGEVPLHTHQCAATMVVTGGSARKLTAAGLGNIVKPGDVVAKGPKEPHGFTDIGPDGFRFTSISEGAGILHDDGILDLAFA